MARGDSEIRVRITGDARSLQTALKTADAGVGGMGSTLLKGAVALGVVKGGFEGLEGTTHEADRLADATERLRISIGDVDTGKLQDAAGAYRDLGLSSQDVLEGAAAFADIATHAGIAAPDTGRLADEVAATAAAVSLLGDEDPATVIANIGKAAEGNDKALRALGISITDAAVEARALATTGKASADALTDGELATARLALILEALEPKLAAATTGTSDLEQNQRALDAAAEELSGKLGGPLSDALAGVLGFINDEVDAIPGAIEGWQMLGAAIEGFGRTALGPLGNVRDAVEGLFGMVNNVERGLRDIAGLTLDDLLGGGEQSVRIATRNRDFRNGNRRTVGEP